MPSKLKKANAKFAKMSKTQKRVAIAKDVIAQIKCEKFIPETSIYVSFAKPLGPKDEGKELQKLLPLVGECTVCARGALFLSSVRKFNACEFQGVDVVSNTNISFKIERVYDGVCHEIRSEQESKFFSDYQMSMIESAFERRSMNKNGCEPQGAVLDRCLHFGDFPSITTLTDSSPSVRT